MALRALLLSLLFCQTLQATAASRHDPALESRIESLLGDILGPGKAHIFIESNRIPVNLTPWINPASASALWERLSRVMAQTPRILPGYSLPFNFKEEVLRATRASSTRRVYKTVRKVTMVLDSRLSLDQTQEAVRMTSEILNLNPKQGDEIKIIHAPLHRAWPEMELTKPSTFPLRWRLACLAAGLALWGIIVWRRASRPKTQGIRLALLGQRHVQAIADFLQHLSPRVAARALGALRRSMAVEVFLRMPAAHQSSVAEILARGFQHPYASGDWISRLEAHIAARISGPGLLEDILLRCPEWTKQIVLTRLDAVLPRAAHAIRESLPTLADLAAASLEDIEFCLSPFSCEELALCLYDAPSSQCERILNALPRAVADKVHDRLKYLVPDSLERAERSRAEICARWHAIRSRARTHASMKLAPLALLLFAGCFASGCRTSSPGLASRTDWSTPYDRTRLSDSAARLQTISKELGLPNQHLEAELYQGEGGQEAKEAMEAYANRSDLKAVLLAQAALGSDPDNETRRLLLKTLAQRTGIEPEADGVLGRAALLQHELRQADDAFFDARFGAAIEACRRALELNSDNSGAWLRLGSAYFALGQRTQARSAYYQALELNPRDSELKEFLREQGWLSKK